MLDKNILGIKIDKSTKKNILEQIIKSINVKQDFFHIVSLNPENLVIATENAAFKKVVTTAQMKIIDGAGVVAAGRLLGVEVGERYPGVDLMEDLLTLASQMRLRVLFIGGEANLAEELAKCYQVKHPQAKYAGMMGIKNINFPEESEEKQISAIVGGMKPNIVFTAFGSPAQEIWLDRHKELFKECICMGVGGGFDFLSGKVQRAPKLIRQLGFEWLYRLLHQPWRWKRQLRLINFFFLVVGQKLTLWKKQS